MKDLGELHVENLLWIQGRWIPWTEEPGGLQSIGSPKSRTRLSDCVSWETDPVFRAAYQSLSAGSFGCSKLHPFLRTSLDYKALPTLKSVPPANERTLTLDWLPEDHKLGATYFNLGELWPS